MGNILEWVETLTGKDHKAAYKALLHLLEESRQGDGLAGFIEYFFTLLADQNSYVRTRGLLLIAANARWDKGNIINEKIEVYLSHIEDEKPITAKQCIQALPELVAGKPMLKVCVQKALEHADVSKYKDSMAPLIIKDIQEALRQME